MRKNNYWMPSMAFVMSIVALGYFLVFCDFDAKMDGHEKGTSDWLDNCGAVELVKFLKRHNSISAGCANYIAQTKDGYNCQSKMICFDPEKEKYYLGFFETEILIGEKLRRTFIENDKKK